MKKQNIYILFLFFSSISLSQVNTFWQSKTDIPTARKEISDAATVLDGQIYVLGGRTNSGNITNAFEVYNPAPSVDNWVVLPAYPIPVWRASIEAVNGKIYVFGGYQSLNPFPFNPTNQAYYYDLSSAQWVQIANLLSPRASAASVVLNGKIHLIGGANNNALNSHHIYDPDTNTWSVAPAMNQNRSGLTASVVNNKIYVFGGYFLSGGVVSLNSVESYNSTTNSWTNTANMPYTKLGITSSVFEDKIYVFGNENNFNVLIYDTLLDTWEESIEMPENVNFAASVPVGDLIYLIGGGQIDLTADGINKVNCFSPTSLSINEFENQNKFKVYPNPSENHFTINSSLFSAYSKLKLKLFNINGQLVKEEIILNNDFNPSITINTSNINSGNYFFSIFNKTNQLFTGKVIIN